MTINAVTDRGNIVVSKDDLTGSPWFLEFLRSVFFALFGWKRSFTGLKTVDFGNIVAGGELTTTLTVTGARAGDAVLVTSKAKAVGLGCDGFVLANDTVTIRRFNYSLGAIDPASDDFRVVVLQQ
jgi:hypothetical protein